MSLKFVLAPGNLLKIPSQIGTGRHRVNTCSQLILRTKSCDTSTDLTETINILNATGINIVGYCYPCSFILFIIRTVIVHTHKHTQTRRFTWTCCDPYQTLLQLTKSRSHTPFRTQRGDILILYVMFALRIYLMIDIIICVSVNKFHQRRFRICYISSFWPDETDWSCLKTTKDPRKENCCCQPLISRAKPTIARTARTTIICWLTRAG